MQDPTDDRDFLICALDTLSGVLEALGPKTELLLGRSGLRDIILHCCQARRDLSQPHPNPNPDPKPNPNPDPNPNPYPVSPNPVSRLPWASSVPSTDVSALHSSPCLILLGPWPHCRLAC